MIYPEVAPPEGFRALLRSLLPRIAMHVPDDVLALWFPPGAVAGVMDAAALAAAQAFGAECGCGFSYLSDRHEGVFHKAPPREVRTVGSLL